MVLTNLYSGFQTVVPASIRKELNLKLEDSLDWSIEDGKMIIEIKRQRSMSDLSEFEITAPEPTDSVDLKRRSARGEF